MAAGGKDRQSANLQWLRCLRCCDSAKDDRQMVLLSCSHILCASCISAIQSKEAGKLICPICKKSVKSIPVNSSKVSVFICVIVVRHFHVPLHAAFPHNRCRKISAPCSGHVVWTSASKRFNSGSSTTIRGRRKW